MSQPRSTEYLQPILDLCPSGGWLAVATLNYDLALEAAARDASVPVATGVESWVDTGDWQWPERGIRLMKVHGSINWRVESTSRIDTMQQYRITVVDPKHKLSTPAVIFGGRNKLRTDGPFLELLAQFEAMLRDASTLLVVGYSFRDDHVNHIVKRWINRSTLNRIVVVEPLWDQWTLRSTDSFRGPEFQRDLVRALSGEHGRPAAASEGTRPSQDEIPLRPRRLTGVSQTARLGLLTACAIAAAGNESWAPTH